MSAVLIRDDGEWIMPGFGRPSPRRLRVWRLADSTLLAVITDRGPGTSVTNVAEHAYAKVRSEYPDEIVRVVEHSRQRHRYPWGALR